MSRPKISRDRVEALLNRQGLLLSKEKVVLVGVRGYFLNSMGKKNKNDIGIYDDALIWVDLENMVAFNANTDPSRYYKNVATLSPGLWTYKMGWHGYGKASGHAAFRQAEAVFVMRYQDDGSFKKFPLGDTINIHRGGANTTSSAGCQTVPPAQWASFKEYGYMTLKKHEKKTFKYLLLENVGDIA